MTRTRLTLLVLALILTACAASGTVGGDDPAKNVVKYLQAKVKGDSATMRGLLCSKMEAQLEMEATTFTGTAGVSIEGLACKLDGNNQVSCKGKITALYGKEKMEFPLTAYRVVKEDGEWKWCGETK
jgi:hypothetical protein